MATVIAIPILLISVILQSAIVSQSPLLHGSADLVLLVITAWALQERVRTAWQWSIIGGLMIGYISMVPIGIPIVAYLATTGLALALRRRIWQIPFLAMLVVILSGTLLIQLSTAIFLNISGTALPWLGVINQVVLPSLLLNLLLALPIYVVIRELADWVHPEEIEI